MVKLMELFIKIWEVIKDADERLGFKKVLMYTAYGLALTAIINWKAILSEINEYMISLDTEHHDKTLAIRDKINQEIHPYLIELRARLGADRVMLFEFHNSVSSLIGIPFKYIGLTDHAEPYGVKITPKFNDVNAEVIGGFIRNLQTEVFYESRDLNKLRDLDPFVPEVLNDPNAIASCYQYMSVLGKPLGILVVEFHNPNNLPNDIGWKKVRNLCNLASQDLNSIITKHKSEL